AVLDRRTASENRRLRAVRALRMDDGSLPELARLAARRLNLRVAHRLEAAFADAAAREDLDEVRALLVDPFVDQRADLIGRAAVVEDLVDRREDAGPGHAAVVDP